MTGIGRLGLGRTIQVISPLCFTATERPDESKSGREALENLMNVDKMKKGPLSTYGPQKPSAEELAGIIRDLHQLLESYAPWWYTEDMDTRVRGAVQMFALPRKSPQQAIAGNGSHP